MGSPLLSRAEAGKVFTKLLPSNGYPRYIIYIHTCIYIYIPFPPVESSTTQLRRRVHTSLPYACWVSIQSHLSNNNRPTWHHTFWSFSTGERSQYNDRPGFCSPQRQRTFFFSTALTPVPGFTQPPIQRVPGTSSPEVKRPGIESRYSPPPNAEVKNGWAVTTLLLASSWCGA
jgi:hypothetical protein